MTFGFRVCFTLVGKGSLTSDDEFISFVARAIDLPLKLSSGSRGVKIGENDRFSISGGAFPNAEDGQAAADQVRIALLQLAVEYRWGLDLGQQSLKGFAMSSYGEQYVADLLKVQKVQADHLGITIFRNNPKPKFVRINAMGTASRTAQAVVDQLSSSVGRFKFNSQKAEAAAGIYAVTHFVGRAPARFLLLFTSLESLFEPAPRSEEARTHVQSLIEVTKQAQLDPAERDTIASTLTFLKNRSIHQTGRDLASRLLGEQKYDGLEAELFFSKVYGMRNKIVHEGEIDPTAIQSIVGELDRFVSDLIRGHYVGS